MTCII